jgi:hypothetical protein
MNPFFYVALALFIALILTIFILLRLGYHNAMVDSSSQWPPLEISQKTNPYSNPLHGQMRT